MIVGFEIVTAIILARWGGALTASESEIERRFGWAALLMGLWIAGLAGRGL